MRTSDAGDVEPRVRTEVIAPSAVDQHAGTAVEGPSSMMLGRSTRLQSGCRDLGAERTAAAPPRQG
jgi:hypothetical protein